MKRQILKILSCPNCGDSLELIENKVIKDEVIIGMLNCTSCNFFFKIINGVPRMILELGDRAELAQSWGFQWNKAAEKKFEIDTLYGKTEDEELNEFFHFLDVTRNDLKGKHILDAGCGSARLTKALGRFDAQVFGIDIASSVDKIYEECRFYKNVNILQADLMNPPFRRALFDYVWARLSICYVRETRDAFRKLSYLVKPSGKLFIFVPDETDLPFVVKFRDFLKISHKIPRTLLFYFSWCLAPTLFLAKRVFKKDRTSLRTNALYLFNAMQPEFITRHNEAEVTAWFRDENFFDICRIPNAGRGIHLRAIKSS